ncbi:MAG: hypothetical protein GX795_10285, partial [Firmicutes bacterium]|nr:hypothetical protein [Bacillota bacterium]
MINGARGAKCIRLIALVLVMAIATAITGFATQAAGERPLGSPVTIELKGADVRDVLKILAELGNVNIVSDPTVRGEISLSLKEVPITDAVELVTRATGLSYRYVGNTLVVGLPERFKTGFDHIETRIVKLDYASPEDMKDALRLVVPPDKIQMDS